MNILKSISGKGHSIKRLNIFKSISGESHSIQRFQFQEKAAQYKEEERQKVNFTSQEVEEYGETFIRSFLHSPGNLKLLTVLK